MSVEWLNTNTCTVHDKREAEGAIERRGMETVEGWYNKLFSGWAQNTGPGASITETQRAAAASLCGATWQSARSL